MNRGRVKYATQTGVLAASRVQCSKRKQPWPGVLQRRFTGAIKRTPQYGSAWSHDRLAKRDLSAWITCSGVKSTAIPTRWSHVRLERARDSFEPCLNHSEAKTRTRWLGWVAHVACYGWQVGLPAIQLTATELLNFSVGDDRSHSFCSRS